MKKQKKDDLKEFKKRCEFWIKTLSLTDWDWRCEMSDELMDNANVLLNPEGRKAYIGLCHSREDCITIEQLSIHEVLEILLADLAFMAEKEFSKDKVNDEIHKVINRLMPIMLGYGK